MVSWRPGCVADPVTGVQQFTALEQHYKRVSPTTKAILLSSFIKMQHLYPELIETMSDMFRMNSDSQDAEIQQRCVEYTAMSTINHDVVTSVLDSMPPFPERESTLEARLARAKSAAKVWQLQPVPVSGVLWARVWHPLVVWAESVRV